MSEARATGSSRRGARQRRDRDRPAPRRRAAWTERQRRARARPRSRVLPPALRGAVRRCSATTGSTSPTGAAIPTSGCDGPGTEVARVLADCARARRARARPRLAFAPRPGALQRAGEPAPRRDGERGGRRGAARRAGPHAAAATTRSCSSSAARTDPDDDVAFVGGIDLCHGRNDDRAPRRRPAGRSRSTRATDPGRAWHDVQLEVRGPAVGDLAWTFRERWEDPTPLDHRNPVRARAAQGGTRAASDPTRCRRCRATRRRAAPRGAGAAHVPGHAAAAIPFAPDGERSIARTYLKVFRRAERLIYVEDQYLWSEEAADALAEALRRAPQLRLVAVVPRYPDRDGRFSGPPYRIGAAARVRARLAAAGGDRVAVFDLENARPAGRSTCTPRSASSTTCG